jgi:uncharacterized membrane protein YphA (DoxX/SURF4 family)
MGFLLGRLTEPSSWGAIAAALGAFAAALPPGSVAQYASAGAAACTAVAAFILKEKGGVTVQTNNAVVNQAKGEAVTIAPAAALSTVPTHPTK